MAHAHDSPLICSLLIEANDPADGTGQPVPVRRLFRKLCPPEARQRVEFRPPVVLCIAPFGFDPPLLFELVKGGIKRPIADLQDVARYLLQADADRPTVKGLE